MSKLTLRALGGQRSINGSGTSVGKAKELNMPLPPSLLIKTVYST